MIRISFFHYLKAANSGASLCQRNFVTLFFILKEHLLQRIILVFGLEISVFAVFVIAMAVNEVKISSRKESKVPASYQKFPKIALVVTGVNVKYF